MKVFSFIKNIKLNKDKPVIKHIALLMATLMILVVAVFAWFSYGKTKAEAGDLSISMKMPDSMQISLDGGNNFVIGGIDILSADDQKFIGNSNKIIGEDGKLLLSMQDITSDGKNFLRPKFNEEDGQSIPDTTQNWDSATKNRAYISQDIIFRTDEPCDIFMGSDTKIITSCEIDKKQLVSDTASEIGNKSTAGNFSNDCIVGALRISVVSDNECKFVCIPRSDIELVRNANGITINTGDNVSDDAKIHTHYDSTYQTTGDTVDNIDPILAFNGTQKIASTTEKITRDGKDGYEAKATVNLWLEGCDPEVTRLLSGGKYQVTFDFLAIKK